MPYVEAKTTIKGSGKEIFDIVKDMAGYPSFMKDVISVDILEVGENYDVSHWVTNADGRRIVWTERDDCIGFSQGVDDIRGDIFPPDYHLTVFASRC